MNQNNYGSIFVGALIGAGLGYLLADWYIETYIPEEGVELNQLDQITKFESRLAKKKERHVEKQVVKNYTEFFRSEQRPDLATLASRYAGEQTVDVLPTVAYKYAGEQTVDVPAREDEEYEGLREAGHADADDDEDTEELMDDGNDPGIISVHVYANDEEHTHVTLKYYTDDVLTDGADVPINRPEKFLPDDTFTSFGQMSNDEDIVYIRNSEKKCMYEIVRLDIPYARETSGHIRKQAKKKEMGDVEGSDD